MLLSQAEQHRLWNGTRSTGTFCCLKKTAWTTKVLGKQSRLFGQKGFQRASDLLHSVYNVFGAPSPVVGSKDPAWLCGVAVHAYSLQS